MDNKINLYINLEQKLKDNLMQERKKTVTNCMNLECKNDQLKVLIERLHTIASKRESLLLQTNNQKPQSKDSSNLLFKKSNISEELEIAKENSKKLESAISRLKIKISVLDEELDI